MLSSSQEEEKKEVSSVIGSGSIGSNENSMRILHEDDVLQESSKPTQQQNPLKPKVGFSVLNVVKDDKNFEAFFGRFLELQQKCDLEKVTTQEYAKEQYFGNIEYKLKLANPDLDRVEHLTTQMKFRLKVLSFLNVQLILYRKEMARHFI